MDPSQPNPALTSTVTVSTITSSTQVAVTPVDVTRLIYMLYQDIEIQINRADLKAQITLSTSAILAAMVANLGLGMHSREMATWSAAEWLALGAYTMFGMSICGSIGHALAAAFPRSIGHASRLTPTCTSAAISSSWIPPTTPLGSRSNTTGRCASACSSRSMPNPRS